MKNRKQKGKSFGPKGLFKRGRSFHPQGWLSQMQGFCLALYHSCFIYPIFFLAQSFGRVQGVCPLPPGTVLKYCEDVQSGKLVLSTVEGNNEVIAKKSRQKRIELSLGKYAIVDAEDFERLSIYKWCAVRRNRIWYAKTLRPDGSHLSMHRLITNAPKHLMVDHRDHNGLNNRKANLRLCTNAENQYNRLPHRGGTSKHKGVYFDRQYNRYRATICHKSKRYNLGRFDNADDAAKAYDKKAKELFGEFAYLNFPDG